MLLNAARRPQALSTAATSETKEDLLLSVGESSLTSLKEEIKEPERMKPARSGPSTMIHELEKTINDQQEVIRRARTAGRAVCLQHKDRDDLETGHSSSGS